MPYKDPEKRKAAHRRYMRTRYREDKEFRNKHKQLVREGKSARRSKHRQIVAEFKGQGCVRCGEDAHCCLSAHHTEPGTKGFNISVDLHNVSEARLRAELAKCLCACENCHRKHHAGLISLQPP